MDSTSRHRAEATLRERALLESFSARIRIHLIECGDFAEMLRSCTQTMVDDLGAAFARIWILNERDNMLELQASSGLYTNLEGRHARIAVGSWKVGLIAAERTPHLTNHVIGDPRIPEQEWARREGMVAFAGYPLIIDHRVIGVMAMFSRSALSESTLHAMSLVADQIALGIQRKQEEQAMRQKEERLTLALQAGRMGAYDWDLVTDAVWWSPETYRLFGVSADEFVPTAKGFEQCIHPEDRDRVWQQFTEALHSGEDCTYEFRTVRSDGSLRWIANLGRNQYSATGRPIRHYGIASDITERRKVDHTRSHLAAIVESSNDGIISTELNGTITTWNAAAERIFGYTASEAIGQSFTLLVPADRHDEELNILTRIRLGECVDRYETVRRRKDDTLLNVSLTVSPITDGQGHIVGASKIERDITERKQWEAALLDSEDRLRSFSGQLEQLVQERTEELTQSHDRLRGLATELNLAEQRERKRLATELHDHLQQLLVLGRMKLHQGKEYVETLPQCATLIREADGILSEALTYTRTLVADLSPPVLRDHGLAAGLRWLGDYMHKHDMAVTVTVPEASPKIPEDQALLLFQSVRELLMNAWKYAGTGQAEVTMGINGNQLRLQVHDDGRGFELAAAHPASNKLTTKFGLFSIRERMRALGGSFEIETAPNRGTTSSLSLPLSASSTTEAEPMLVEASQEGFGKDSHNSLPPGENPGTVGVLLVDDHAMVRQGLRTMLERYADVEVVGEACNGEEALMSSEQLKPAVVVMDINMPKMNGIEATARLKARYPHIAVIGLSVNVGEENQRAMKKAGAMSLITKEAAVDQLYSAIRETASRSAHLH